MQELLQTISSLRDLRILHLDGQRFSDSDVEPLLDFLRGHQNRLVEFSCDESALSTAQRFYSFYQEIDRLNLSAVGRPHSDLVRLFQRPQPNMPQEFEAFRASIQKRHVATSQSIRAFYMCRQNPGAGFEPEEMYKFSDTYPRYATIDRRAIWFLYPKSSGAEIPSLCTLVVPGPFESLAKTHVQLLMDPMALPRFPPAPEIAVIDTFAEESAQLFGTTFPGGIAHNVMVAREAAPSAAKGIRVHAGPTADTEADRPDSRITTAETLSGAAAGNAVQCAGGSDHNARTDRAGNGSAWAVCAPGAVQRRECHNGRPSDSATASRRRRR
jgi:hypothetical protein